MKFKDIILVIVIIGACLFIYKIARKEDRTDRNTAIDSLYRSHSVLINFDSVSSVMRKQILDSVRIITDAQAKKIDAVHKENLLIRKQNEILTDRYKSITVDRPDF